MPLHVSVSFETILRGSMAVLRYVTELECCYKECRYVAVCQFIL
jgi:hypothetical protein